MSPVRNCSGKHLPTEWILSAPSTNVANMYRFIHLIHHRIKGIVLSYKCIPFFLYFRIETNLSFQTFFYRPLQIGKIASKIRWKKASQTSSTGPPSPKTNLQPQPRSTQRNSSLPQLPLQRPDPEVARPPPEVKSEVPWPGKGHLRPILCRPRKKKKLRLSFEKTRTLNTNQHLSKIFLIR